MQTVVGLTQKTKLIGPKGKIKKVISRIDTGATRSSIDKNLAKELKLGPVIKKKLIKSASGNTLRPIVRATIEIKGRKIKAEFTIADRSHMKYKALIGQNILKKNFLINPSL